MRCHDLDPAADQPQDGGTLVISFLLGKEDGTDSEKMAYIEEVADQIYRRLQAHSVVPKAPLSMPENDRGLFLIYAVLALSVGEDVTGEDVHNAWAAWISIQRKNHQALQPYEELSAEEQERDEPFRVAIQEVARTRRSGWLNRS